MRCLPQTNNGGSSHDDVSGFFEEKRLLTVPEVAEILNVTPITVWRWIYEGKIPSLKVGGTRRFSPKTLSNWLNKECNGSR